MYWFPHNPALAVAADRQIDSIDREKPGTCLELFPYVVCAHTGVCDCEERN